MSQKVNRKLHDACRSGNLETVVLLVSRGVNIHANNDYVMLVASEHGHLEVVKYLVFKCSANIHAHNDAAVRVASQRGRLDVVKYLVFQGADIHAEDDYAVRFASQRGHLDVVRYLVSKGADIHARNNAAVRLASQREYPDVVAYLVSQGAPITAISEFQLQYIAIYMKHHKRREIRAESKIYFWWIQRCYQMSSPTGIRMAYRNLAEYESLCEL